MKRKLCRFALVALSLGAPAWAQSSDVTQLKQKVQQLEQMVQDLKQQIADVENTQKAPGMPLVQTPGAPAPTSPKARLPSCRPMKSAHSPVSAW